MVLWGNLLKAQPVSYGLSFEQFWPLNVSQRNFFFFLMNDSFYSGLAIAFVFAQILNMD